MRAVAIIVPVALIVVTSCHTPPAEHPSPERAGTGWTCLAEHPLSVFATSCWRTDAECTLALQTGQAKTPACGRYAEAARTGRQGARNCVKSPEAACTAIGGARVDRRVICAATMQFCEEMAAWLVETPELYREYVFAELGGCTEDVEARKRIEAKLVTMKADLATVRPLGPLGYSCRVWD